MTMLLAALLLAAAPAATEPPLGRYRLQGGPDTVGELDLQPGGHFEYGLSAGALDEGAQGDWTSDGRVVRLTTRPTPHPPVFSAGAQNRDPAVALSLKIVAPDGYGIAGVDFRIGFTDGSVEQGYTQDYGWSLARGGARKPAWIEMAVPMHELVSPRFALDPAAGNAFTFVLTPNDLGLVDFEGVVLDLVPGKLVMHRGLGELVFVRSDRDSNESH
ncbi:MAG: hypothetical protein JWP15_2493 [Alphaproteobacteria bacterium]|nr:hypothetical protein [Alphaproteobacteria bacterium]